MTWYVPSLSLFCARIVVSFIHSLLTVADVVSSRSCTYNIGGTLKALGFVHLRHSSNTDMKAWYLAEAIPCPEMSSPWSCSGDALALPFGLLEEPCSLARLTIAQCDSDAHFISDFSSTLFSLATTFPFEKYSALVYAEAMVTALFSLHRLTNLGVEFDQSQSEVTPNPRSHAPAPEELEFGHVNECSEDLVRIDAPQLETLTNTFDQHIFDI
jgi:hypothetical protein